MAPIKFEEHIKEKLDEREIQPSPRVWDEIASQIQKAPVGKKAYFFRYGLVAGIAAVIVLSIFYFTPKVGKNTDQTEESTVEKSTRDVEGKQPILIQEVAPLVKGMRKGENLNHKEPLSEKSMHSRESPAGEIESDNVSVADVNGGNKEEELWIGSNELINAKIAELITQVDVLENTNSIVTDKEVDSLIRRAQREIVRERILGKDNPVDATALLREVEDELDKSFRDQIFETLKAGYLKVRTAVAERNN